MRRFLVDSMLKRVGKILRMMGYDTLIRENETFEQFVENEGIVITRRKKISEGLKRKLAKRLLQFEDEDDLEIVRKVVRLFGKNSESEYFTRCLLCNTKLTKPTDIPDELIKFKNLMYCPKCKKYYWEGLHVGRMKKLLKRIFNE